MTIEYRQAAIEDAELLIGIYNDAYYDDYLRYGYCPGYGITKEGMEESIRTIPKYIIMCDNMPVGCISSKQIETLESLYRNYVRNNQLRHLHVTLR